MHQIENSWLKPKTENEESEAENWKPKETPKEIIMPIIGTIAFMAIYDCVLTSLKSRHCNSKNKSVTKVWTYLFSTDITTMHNIK